MFAISQANQDSRGLWLKTLSGPVRFSNFLLESSNWTRSGHVREPGRISQSGKIFFSIYRSLGCPDSRNIHNQRPSESMVDLRFNCKGGPDFDLVSKMAKSGRFWWIHKNLKCQPSRIFEPSRLIKISRMTFSHVTSVLIQGWRMKITLISGLVLDLLQEKVLIGRILEFK